jgi:hypothetical protein
VGMMLKLLINFLVTMSVLAPVAAAARSASPGETSLDSHPSINGWFVIGVKPSDQHAHPLVSQKRNGRVLICTYKGQPPVNMMADQLCPKFGLVVRLGKRIDK